jgi:hypothetical protein
VRRVAEASLSHLTGTTVTSLLDGILSSYDLADEICAMIDLTSSDPSGRQTLEENPNGNQ